MRIILLGPPGAGKGTQARFLANFYHIPLIATGEILRTAVQAGAKLGLAAKAIMETGALVPDEIMIDLVKERLSQPDCANGYLLDGFPRTIPQAEALAKANIEIDYVIEIAVPDEEIITRLTGRRVHPASGRAYHLQYNPPKVVNCDDLTGEALVLRDDDKPETVTRRLAVYHAQTEPLIVYYREQAQKDAQKNAQKFRYVQIEGSGTIEEIQQKVIGALT